MENLTDQPVTEQTQVRVRECLPWWNTCRMSPESSNVIIYKVFFGAKSFRVDHTPCSFIFCKYGSQMCTDFVWAQLTKLLAPTSLLTNYFALCACVTNNNCCKCAKLSCLLCLLVLQLTPSAFVCTRSVEMLAHKYILNDVTNQII